MEIITFVVSTLTLLAVLWYAYLTKKIAAANVHLTEYTVRPVLGFQVEELGSTDVDLKFSVQNLSRTDAVGFVILKLIVNGTTFDINEQGGAYDLPSPLLRGSCSGRLYWYFPANQNTAGHVKLKTQLNALGFWNERFNRFEYEKFNIKLMAFTFCRVWNHTDQKFTKDGRYYSPPKVYRLISSPNGEMVYWVPELTFSGDIEHFEPDWKLIE